MKLENLATRKGVPPRKPLRSVKELAAEFGVSRQKLAGALSAADAPAVELKHGGNGRPCNSWYDPDLVRAWWKTRTFK